MTKIKLSDYSKSIYSQFGQDGVLEKIVELINPPKFFVEFGSSGTDDGGGNTINLRKNGWTGLLFDQYKNNPQYDLKHEKICAYNIEDIFKKYDVPKHFGFLSIDIDGIDYWVWKAIENWDVDMVCIESNHYLGTKQMLTVPNNPDFEMKSSYYFGASQQSLLNLGISKGYTLVAICVTDLIFVKTQLLKNLYVEYDIEIENINDLDKLDVAKTHTWVSKIIEEKVRSYEWVETRDNLVEGSRRKLNDKYQPIDEYFRDSISTYEKKIFDIVLEKENIFAHKDNIEDIINGGINKIDVLYIDLSDITTPDCANINFEFYFKYLSYLHDNSYIIINDTDIEYLNGEIVFAENNTSGKGKLIVPHALNQRYEIIFSGRMTCLKKMPGRKQEEIVVLESVANQIYAFSKEKALGYPKITPINEFVFYIQKSINQLHSLIGYGTAAEPSLSGEKIAFEYAIKKFSDSKIIFDVGAHEGEWLDVCSNLLPEGKYHCFEPENNSFFKLKEKYGNKNNMILNNYAISEENGEAELFTHIAGAAQASLYKRDLGHIDVDFSIQTPTKMKRIDTYCMENKIDKIDFIKIDTEGSEYSIISSMIDMVIERRVKFIQFEFGICCLDARVFLKDFYKLIRPYYNFYRILPTGLYDANLYREEYEVFQVANYLCERV